MSLHARPTATSLCLLASAAALGACTPASPTASSSLGPASAAEPPPGTLTLVQTTPLYLGETTTVQVAGALPGRLVHLAASVASSGQPFCPAPLRGTCLDLDAPASRVGFASASAAGVATLQLTPPTSVGQRTVVLQALQLDQGTVLTSDPLPTFVYDRTGDLDGDGLSNQEELETTGTDPRAADSDGDGLDDDHELDGGSDPNDADDPAAGWQLVWHDEFDGPSIDPSKWSFEVNGQGGGNDELQYYTDRPANARIEDGALVIEARAETFTGPDGTRDYTSARLRTLGAGDWRYGRIEARLRTPVGQGLWPAFWMLPSAWVYGGWAASGEIDIMELVGHDPNTVHGTLHYGGAWPQNTYTGQGYTLPTSFGDDFHTFAVTWEPGEIRWYVDGQHTQTQNQWFTTAAAFPAPFDQQFHILLNVAVGGNWPGAPDASTTFPQRMTVDYVRVFQQPGGATMLSNGSFEQATPGPGGSVPAGWLVFPTSLTNLAAEPTGAPIYNSSATFQAIDGLRALKLWGQFTGSENRTPVYQEFVASPGERFTLSVRATTHQDDAIAPGNRAEARILFLDAAYNVLGSAASVPVDASSPRGTWLPLTVTATAPAGTARVQASMEFRQCVASAGGCYAPGSVYFDEAAFERL